MLRAVVVIFLLQLVSGGTWAESSSGVKTSEYHQKSVEIKEKEREILATLYAMTRRQRKLVQLKADHLEKREGLESDINDLQQNIEDVGGQIKTMRKKIATRTRNLYKINAPTIFQTIFGSQDLAEMDRNSRILYRLSKSEIDQLRDYRGLKNLLDQQQQELETKLLSLEKTQKDLDKKEEEIKKTYYAQMQMLKKLESEDQKILQVLKNIKGSSKNSELSFYAPALGGGVRGLVGR